MAGFFRKPRREPFIGEKALLKDRIVLLLRPIDDEVATEVVAKLLFLQSENGKLPIHLYINSPGGSVSAGLAIIETMKSVSPAVHTRCIGTADALAAIVLACGARGQREIMHNGKVSLLPAWSDQPDSADALYRTRLVLNDVLANATGRDVEQIAAELRTPRWFDPHGAVVYGLADRVIDEQFKPVPPLANR